jgi:hypothetical protein
VQPDDVNGRIAVDLASTEPGFLNVHADRKILLRREPHPVI